MNKGKIYKVYNEGGIYYGSTIQSLSRRLAMHKSKKSCSSRILFDRKFSDPKIELIEEFYYDDIKELRDREGYYIKNLECINKKIAGRTQKEYNYDNKDKIKIQTKEYRERNKEHIKQTNKKYYENNKDKKLLKCKEYQKIKVTCDCGSIIPKYQYKRHCKSKKHQKYLTTIV